MINLKTAKNNKKNYLNNNMPAKMSILRGECDSRTFCYAENEFGFENDHAEAIPCYVFKN